MSKARRNWHDNNDTPPPGSDQAVNRGCTCPVIDNGHGDGYYMGGYVIRSDCPIHDSEPSESVEKKDAEGDAVSE